MYVYLDYNVYIECLKDDNLIRFITGCRDTKNFQLLYSPAHIEETYTAETLEKSSHKEKMSKLRKIIDEITSSMEILPSMTELIIKNEPTKSVYTRVKGMDTTKIVADHSLARFYIDDSNYKKMVKDDKHNTSISNLSSSKIWEHPMVRGIIDDYNAHRDRIIRSYNASAEVLGLLYLGLDKRLPDDFVISRGSYNERLKHKFTELEYTVEFLMRVLNFCGYNAEKNEKTAISSTHDTTHCIYATVADCMISMDKRFAKKCEAVYDFLGISTQVRFCQNAQEVRKIVEEL